jgi:hypothetical protein
MLGGWSERMEGRLLWLLRLGRGLAEGRSERMRGLRLLWPWWTSARVGGRMRDGGGETGE